MLFTEQDEPAVDKLYNECGYKRKICTGIQSNNSNDCQKEYFQEKWMWIDSVWFLHKYFCIASNTAAE